MPYLHSEEEDSNHKNYQIYWNQFKYNKINDQAASINYCYNLDNTTFQINQDIAHYFFVIFVKLLSNYLLPIFEVIWSDRLDATINISNMPLPTVK